LADALWIGLLKAEKFRRYFHNPELLRAELSMPSQLFREFLIFFFRQIFFSY